MRGALRAPRPLCFVVHAETRSSGGRGGTPPGDVLRTHAHRCSPSTTPKVFCSCRSPRPRPSPRLRVKFCYERHATRPPTNSPAHELTNSRRHWPTPCPVTTHGHQGIQRRSAREEDGQGDRRRPHPVARRGDRLLLLLLPLPAAAVPDTPARARRQRPRIDGRPAGPPLRNDAGRLAVAAATRVDRDHHLERQRRDHVDRPW